MYAGPTDEKQLERLLARVEKDEDKPYFDKEANEKEVKMYYKNIKLTDLNSLEKLVKETHTKQVNYDPSEYVYPWVDLRPDRKLVSIYSGDKRDVKTVIQEDYETSLQRQAAVEEEGQDEEAAVNQFKYNCEHAVPQSWFEGEEPMRGDLHHLFTCEPVCNSIRSNYPYYDFKDYPHEEAGMNRIEKHCGKAEDERFEPEHGKGTVARAVLYFIIRYPDRIGSEYKAGIDRNLLIKWHEKEPPDDYERHRNQAIYEIQGNRNPWIDFPSEMVRIMK
nr:endonuclease [Halobacillus sp. A5]